MSDSTPTIDLAEPRITRKNYVDWLEETGETDREQLNDILSDVTDTYWELLEEVGLEPNTDACLAAQIMILETMVTATQRDGDPDFKRLETQMDNGGHTAKTNVTFAIGKASTYENVHEQITRYQYE